MFTGSVSGKRINLGGASKAGVDKASFMEETRRIREQRELTKRKEYASIQIQRIWRGHSTRRKTKYSLIVLLEKRIGELHASLHSLPSVQLRTAVLKQLFVDAVGSNSIASMLVMVAKIGTGSLIAEEQLRTLATWFLDVIDASALESAVLRVRVRAVLTLLLSVGPRGDLVDRLVTLLLSSESVRASFVLPDPRSLQVKLFQACRSETAAHLIDRLVQEDGPEALVNNAFLCFLQGSSEPSLPVSICLALPALCDSDLVGFTVDELAEKFIHLLTRVGEESVRHLIGSFELVMKRASEPVRVAIEQRILQLLLTDERLSGTHALLFPVRLESISEESAFRLATQTRIVQSLADDLIVSLTAGSDIRLKQLVMLFTVIFARVVGGISSGYTSVLSTASLETLFPLLNHQAYAWLSHYVEVDERIFQLIRAVYDKKHLYSGLRADQVWTLPESAILVPTSAYSYDLRSTMDEDVEMVADEPVSGASQSVFDAIMEHMPHVLPFQRRLGFFASALAEDQMRNARYTWRSPITDRLRRVRREFLLEDGLEVISGATRDMLRIEFVGRDGSAESGIDGGGLFKEFMQQWTVAIMNPEFGLFRQLPNGRLTPNPAAYAVHADADRLFRAAGKAVGKALYEMVLLETHVGEAFLNRVLGKAFTLEQLREIDESLFRSLKFVSECDNVDDLALTFSVSMGGDLGSEIAEHELIPGGSNIPVTNNNKLRYVLLASWFHLARQLDRQAAAFAAGLSEIIPLARLRIFSPSEINLLVSGEQRKGFDVDDLIKNLVYGGGYTESSKTIELLFEVLREFSDTDRSAFLAFVTSAPRPPLLGFKVLHPKFGINRVPERDRLPTAATCTNLLKLPDYCNKNLLREKLLVAIHAQSGFDLS